MQIENAKPYRQAVIALLLAENLPAGDLPEELDSFLVILDGNVVTGSVGLEVYGDYGLLRSLAVSKSFRDKGVGDELLKQIEVTAIAKNLTGIYLLTETAPGYFKRKGYAQIDRSAIPMEVQESSEFSHVCPVSAIAMKKRFEIKYETNISTMYRQQLPEPDSPRLFTTFCRRQSRGL